MVVKVTNTGDNTSCYGKENAEKGGNEFIGQQLQKTLWPALYNSTQITISNIAVSTGSVAAVIYSQSLSSCSRIHMDQSHSMGLSTAAPSTAPSLPAAATSEKNKVDKLNCPATVHCPCISCVDDGWSGHSYSACIRISLYGIFYRSITTMQQGRWLPWMSRKNFRLCCTIRNESMSWWWSLRSIRKRIFISSAEAVEGDAWKK